MLTRTSLIAALLLAAAPATPRDLDPSAGINGATGRGAGNQTSHDSGGNGDDESHPFAEGQTFSSPPSFPWSAGASANHGLTGSVGNGSWSPQAQTGTEPGID